MEFLYNRYRFNVATSRARALCHTPRQMKMANGLCRYLELSRTVQTI